MSMETQLQAIENEARQALAEVADRPSFEAMKARFVGPNGSLTQAMKGMGAVPKEDKPRVGKLINQTKQLLEAELAGALQRIESAERAARLGPSIDPTLPVPEAIPGGRHPLAQVRDRIVSAFRRIGFTVAEASEVETEWFCFDALNTPEDHPARDAQDTLFLPDSIAVGNVSRRAEERYLLRSQTSTVQIRTLLREKPPLRIIAPGRCFRRDTVDATHSANFHQIECLYVDRHVSVRDLKAVLDYLLRELFGDTVQSRLRPSFFPFTEPSFEVDLNSPDLGRLSNRWIEIMGCGMVDPAVFDQVGLDPNEWTGYAFGLGIERVAMLLTGIDDIRHFYQNDLRFLRQFA